MRRQITFTKKYILILLVLFGLISPAVQAQVNLKAGYNFSFFSDQGLNQVISTFNTSQQYTRSFKHLTWLQGFEGGVRFKADIHAFELTYQSAYHRLTAEGQLVGETESYTDKINIAVNSLAFGYQVSGDLVGAGVDLQYQWYNSRVKLAAEEDRYKVVQKMWAMKFYLMFTLEGSGYIDAAVQPYYILPFDRYDLDPLSQYLNQAPGSAEEKWTRIGLTLLFYNGGK